MKTISKAAFIIAILFIMTSCSSVFMQNDKFYAVDNQNPASDSFIASSIKISSYEQIFKGSMLAYNPQTETAVLSSAAKSDDNKTVSLMSSYKDEQIRPLALTSKQFISAKIAPDVSTIFFVEKNDDLDKTILCRTDFDGETKVHISQADISSNIAYSASPKGTLIYLNASNELIMRGNEDIETKITFLPSNYIVRKLAYCEEDNVVIFLANVSQSASSSSNILYRLNLYDNFAMNAIDINVSDFAVSEQLHATAYVKGTIEGIDHLYRYDHRSTQTKFILSDRIERISISPYSNYIAYSTKIAEGIPTQSIWIANFSTGIASQLAANTKLSSSIFWGNNERAIYYTVTETAGEGTGVDSYYATYKTVFSFEYTRVEDER